MYWDLYWLILTLGFLYLLYTGKDFVTETWTKLAVADPMGLCSVDKLESGRGSLRVPGTWMHGQIHPSQKRIEKKSLISGETSENRSYNVPRILRNPEMASLKWKTRILIA